MVVLRENYGRGDVPHFLYDRVGEALVDSLVLAPVFGAKDGTRVGNVAEGPEAFIREAFVIAAVFLRGEPDAPQRVGGTRGRYLQVITGINDFAIGVAGAVGNPGTVASIENGFKSGDDAAGGDEHLDGVIALVKDVHVRLPVGDNEE